MTKEKILKVLDFYEKEIKILLEKELQSKAPVYMEHYIHIFRND